MKKIINNYKSTLILILSLIIGTNIGLIFKEQATVLKPFGDLFLNLLFIIIVPLIFLTITTSIIKINNPKRLSKVMFWIFITFIITSLVAVIVGLVSALPFELISSNNQDILSVLSNDSNVVKEELNLLERTVSLISVSDFKDLLSKDNLIALVVFSCLFGLAIRKSETKNNVVHDLLYSLNNVVLKFVDLIMLYAPIGLCCYMASFVGTFGVGIATGYLKTFIIYTLVCILFYIFIYSFYAYLAGGAKGVKLFWKNIIPPTATALATCSSAASIPANIKASTSIGVSDDIANATIPLGTSFHKDGSIIGSVFKIMFLVCLFNTPTNDFGTVINIIVVALIANLLITAVPIGGGTISEMLIISMLGYPLSTLPILTIIATIIDAPATVLNVVGDTASSMLVARFVDGKNWLKKVTRK